jgi:Glycosyltransferase family 87
MWAVSLRNNHLVDAPWSFPPAPWQYLGEDFLRVHRALQFKVAGGNPYDLVVEHYWTFEKYSYPHAVLWAFSWSSYLSARAASSIWIGIAALVVIGSVCMSWRARADLGLLHASLSVALAVVLLSGPVTLMLERGNWDGLVAALVIFALWAMRDRRWLWEIGAGFCLALATWLKIAPGILVLGVLALGRWRVAVAMVLGILGIGLLDLHGVKEFVVNAQAMVQRHTPQPGSLSMQHSLSGSWPVFWEGTRVQWLAAVPGRLAAGLLVLPIVAWVSSCVQRTPAASKLAFPYFMWLVAAACFMLPISYDYKLFFLLLAAVAVWSRRDPLLVHVLMAFLLLVWQPFDLSLPPRLALVFKLGGFWAVGLSLVQRSREQGALPLDLFGWCVRKAPDPQHAPAIRTLGAGQ